MKARKLLVLVMALACIATISITATLAYFTDVSEVVENTFTVGNIDITLDEAPVGDDGKEIEGDRRTENEYELFPGSVYDKDPTVHVQEGSEKCFVYVKVENDLYDIEDGRSEEKITGIATIEEQMKALGWVNVHNNVYAYDGELATNGVVDATNGIVDLVVFENFAIKGNALVSPSEGEEVPEGMINLQDYTKEGVHIQITAYAIQSANFSDYNKAWEAYMTQNGDPTETDNSENAEG